jgi:transcription antitermination factor NusG
VAAQFSAGDRVAATRVPFKGQHGRVLGVDGKAKRLMVEVLLDGTQRAVEINARELRRITDDAPAG